MMDPRRPEGPQAAISNKRGLLKNPSALRYGLSNRAVGGTTGRYEKRVVR